MQKKITILGSGVMGAGVAQLFAQHEFRVDLIDVLPSQLDKAKDSIAKNLRYLALTQKGASIHSIESRLSAITFTTHMDELEQAQYIIENITENWEKKKSLYQLINGRVSSSCVLCVNTSAIPVTKIAALVENPHRVLGVHFMNPAPMMPLVEVIKGYHTDVQTIEKTRALLEEVNKKIIVINDSPGFVSNRAMMIFINEAIFMLHENVASIDDIDVLFKQCFGHKMGPLQTADLIGLDTVLYSLEILHSEFNDSKYRPCWLLKNMVEAGLLGEKTKKGFYQYE